MRPSSSPAFGLELSRIPIRLPASTGTGGAREAAEGPTAPSGA